MADTPEFGRGQPHEQGAGLAVSDLKVWFLREVLPLEAALMQFLRRSGRSKSEIDDLCQDVYVRVFEAAQKQLPQPVRPFVFTIARNLLIDHIRKGQVVPIETVAELGTLDVAFDGPGPDRAVIAREELRRLQVALDQLPDRCREAVVMRKVDGLPRRVSYVKGTAVQSVNAYPPVNRTRSRMVVIPNIGGFAALSYRFPNAKLSAGYRADFFFGARDSGFETRSTADVGFHGPFATISIGLGR